MSLEPLEGKLDGRHIAVVQFSGSMDGSTRSALLSVRALLEAGACITVYLAHPGPAEDAFRHLGVAVSIEPHKNPYRSPGLCRTALNLIRERDAREAFTTRFRESRPDLVLVNSLASLPAAEAAYSVGRPLMLHIREVTGPHGAIRVPVTWQPRLAARLVRIASALVSPSRFAAASVLGRHAGRARIVPNALDPAFDEATEVPEPGWVQGRRIVGLPSPYRAGKGHTFFIDVACELLRTDPTLGFAACGDPSHPIAHEMRQAAEAKGVPLEQTGWIDDMRTFYDACTVMLVPSEAESFGRVIIEAFARGCPVVAARAAALPEIIQSDTQGILYERDSVREAAECVSRLLTDDALRERIATAAYEDARERYAYSTYRDSIVDIAATALAQGDRP